MRGISLLLMLLMLAACGAGGEAAPTASINSVPTATPTPPPYREPTQPLTADTAHCIALLGRLDNTAAPPSTLFSHSFSPDSTRLVALNQDLLIMWNLINGSIVFNSGRRDAARVYYADNKNEFYALDSVGNIAIYETERGILQNALNSAVVFNGTAAYNDLESRLVIGGDNGKTQVWDLVGRVSLATISAHIGAVVSVAIAPDARAFASSGLERTLKVWDIATRAAVFNVTLPDDPAVTLAFSPDSTQLAAGTPETLYVYDIASGALRYSLTLRLDGAADVLKWSPDGRFLVVGGGGSDALLVWAQEGRVVAELLGVGALRVDAAFSPDSTLLATSALDRGVNLWNLSAIDDGNVPTAALNVPSKRITGVSFSPDGFLLAAFEAAGSVFLWGIP